jgi:hypothetical protein
VRFHDGRWLVESAEAARQVVDGEALDVGGNTYQLELPPWPAGGFELGESTLDAATCAEPCLRFVTSRDQEHVGLEALVGGHSIALGARAHNFALLCLARRRLAERRDGTPESECGWFYVEELRDALAVDRVVLNLQLWRAAQAMSKAGLPAERLVERRPDSQQVRIGFSDLLIVEG